MDKPTPQNNPEYLSQQEAREWELLQSEICKKLSTEHITSSKQLDPGLIEPTRVHLVICEVVNHDPIDGIYIDAE